MQRRKFIQQAGLTSGGLLLGNAPFTLAPSQKKEVIRLGIIGVGSRGRGIASLLKPLPNFELAACCDILPFRLEQGMQYATAKTKAYQDYRALLDDKKVDAVIIATPFGLHDEMAIHALQAGKHVFCEKTMAKGLPAIQSVIDAHKKTNLVFQTGHQYNSSALYLKVGHIVQSGYIGEVTAFQCQWNRNGDWRRPVPDTQWERLINWRMYKEHSSGMVAELCSHQIDFINRVLGERPQKIAGFGGIDHWKDGRETYDNLHLIFEYPSGIDATFSCTTTNGFDDYQIRILGKKATILMNYTSALIYLEPKAQKELGIVDGVSGATKKAWEKGEGVPIQASSQDITAQALIQFYEAITQEKPVPSDIKSGAITSKCVQMAFDALHQEKITYWKDYPVLKF